MSGETLGLAGPGSNVVPMSHPFLKVLSWYSGAQLHEAWLWVELGGRIGGWLPLCWSVVFLGLSELYHVVLVFFSFLSCRACFCCCPSIFLCAVVCMIDCFIYKAERNAVS